MNDRKRFVAILCAFVLVFSTAMSGCAKKVKFEKQETTKDNKIKINTVDDEIPEGYSLVMGEDGQSYLVDSEDNSIVYDATSIYVIPNTADNKTTASTKATTTTKKTTTTVKVIPSSATTQPTTSQQDKVLSVLSSRRHNIDDKAGNDLDNYNVDTLDVRFEYGNKKWAVKLFKGKYASSTIGCETCIYILEEGQSNWQEADDADRQNVEMTLWQEIDDENYAKTEEPLKSCWWSKIIQNGSLYGGNKKSLVMRTTINMSTSAMADAFCDALEEKGFAYGSVSGYQNAGNYSVDGRTVTVVWR